MIEQKILKEALINIFPVTNYYARHEDTEMEEIVIEHGVFIKFKDEHDRDKFLNQLYKYITNHLCYLPTIESTQND